MNAPTRRGLLGGVAVLATAPAPVKALAASPDANLLRLGSALVGAWACETDAYTLSEGEDDDEGPNTLRWSAAVDTTEQVVAQIAQETATTLSGLLVKMRAILWCRDGAPVAIKDLQFYPHSSPTTDMRLLAGLVHDLATMGSMAA